MNLVDLEIFGVRIGNHIPADTVSLYQGHLGVSWNTSEEFGVRYSAIRVETSVLYIIVVLKTVRFAFSDSPCMLEHCRVLKGLCSAAWHPLLA